METPETRYTKTAEGQYVAYQVVGRGPIDIVFVPHIAGIEVIWDDPTLAHVLDRLTRFGRLITSVPRGVASSDALPPGELPTPEVWIDDVRVVLDAVDSTAASFVCHGIGGFVGALFAATYPERTGALVLVDAYARFLQAEDYPIGFPSDVSEAIIAQMESGFGGDGLAPLFAPSRADDTAFRRLIARWGRTAFTPSSAMAGQRWSNNLDFRSILSAIRVPTLVMHHRRSRLYPVAFSEYLADNISGARFKLIPGADVYYFSDAADEVVDEIEEFITGTRPPPEPDRALQTVLFTDIVSSSQHNAAVGDRRWRDLLDQHDSLISRELDRHRGRRVNTTGDGVIATFDGPARGVRCAQAIIDAVKLLGIDVRAGLHCGEVELRGADVAGLAVVIGQRVSALAGAGECLVSSTVVDLVAGSGLDFEDKGEHELKGVGRPWRVFAVKA